MIHTLVQLYLNNIKVHTSLAISLRFNVSCQIRNLSKTKTLFSGKRLRMPVVAKCCEQLTEGPNNFPNFQRSLCVKVGWMMDQRMDGRRMDRGRLKPPQPTDGRASSQHTSTSCGGRQICTPASTPGTRTSIKSKAQRSHRSIITATPQDSGLKTDPTTHNTHPLAHPFIRPNINQSINQSKSIHPSSSLRRHSCLLRQVVGSE
jgi:hypothetical protein